MTKVALITGASRGIGRAIALRLADRGHRAMLLGRAADALDEVLGEYQQRAGGGSAQALVGDLHDSAYMDAAVEQARHHFGAVDILVNNAGVARRETAQQADPSAWREVMAVNFEAAVYLSAQLLPTMIEREQGAIINISSISGRSTDAGSGAYAASKHALNGFSGCMYEDVRDHGIKVSTIMPGFVETRLTSAAGLTAEHMIRADDVADCVEFVLNASPWCCPTEIVLRPQKRP